MNLQDMLQKTFGTKIKRQDMFTNWYLRELKDWSSDELKGLLGTAIFFGGEDKKLSDTLKQRIATEMYRRDKAARSPKPVVKKHRKRKGK